MTRIHVVLVTVAAAAIAGLVVIGRALAPSGFTLEVAKALLNVCVVVVLGQTVAFVLNRFAESRKEDAQADKLRLEVVRALTRAFNAAKTIRRTTRADAFCLGLDGMPATITKESYRAAMERLNRTQLSLERVANDIETYASYFREGRQLYGYVHAMEEYLNQIVNEWEHKRPEFTGTPQTCALAELPKFGDFIVGYKPSAFRDNFVLTYYRAITHVRSSFALSQAERLKPSANAQL